MNPQSYIQRYLVERETRTNPSLEGVRCLAEALGHPEAGLKTIQVTGTNGKTSTARMIASFLAVQGLRSAAYTSPHLSSFSERITVDGVPIGEERLDRELGEVVRAAEEVEGGKTDLTAFELLTMTALRVFAREGVGAAVLEVGLGGRWDATSLRPPAVSLITNVELDHNFYLGDTREEVAREKAWVIKPGCRAATGETDPQIVAILEERARAAGVELGVRDRDFSWHLSSRGELLVDAVHGRYRWPVRGMPIFQHENVGLATIGAELFLERSLDQDACGQALSRMDFPGRLEVVARAPLVVLDGAHNPAAAAALAAGLAAMTHDRLLLVLGVLGDKDVEGILRPLLDLAPAAVVCTTNDSERSLPAGALARAVRGRAPVHVEWQVAKALRLARELAQPDDLICVTGSLYTVGLARSVLLNAGTGGPRSA